jgi:DNA-binding beta-propeller fold protein YncE
LKWETHSESFETLHGIDVSSDGEQIYVSGRKDGNLHIFNGGTGKLERSIPLGNNPLAGGVQVFSSP